jgi:hypothetical protein
LIRYKNTNVQKKNLIQQSKEKPTRSRKTKTGHPTGVIQDPEKDHSPIVHVKPGSESFNHRHSKSRSVETMSMYPLKMK